MLSSLYHKIGNWGLGCVREERVEAISVVEQMDCVFTVIFVSMAAMDIK